MTPRLLLIDGHAYAYRAFYAIRRMSAPDGAPTNAIFGFLQMLAKLREVVGPNHLGVIWDGGMCEDRLAALPAYKAHRPPMPVELARQIEEIGEYLNAAGVNAVCQQGVEADDYLAFAAIRAWDAGAEVIIASPDKDFMQLVRPGIGLVNPNDKSTSLWTAEQVVAKSGVRPEQVVDWLSLVGDSVDNIPGVPGVGVKTAAQLLNQFGSIEALYRRLDAIASPRLREVLRMSAEVVRRNQQLIRLRSDLDYAFSLDDYRCRPQATARLFDLFHIWGFRRLAKEVAATVVFKAESLPGFA